MKTRGREKKLNLGEQGQPNNIVNKDTHNENIKIPYVHAVICLN